MTSKQCFSTLCEMRLRNDTVEHCREQFSSKLLFNRCRKWNNIFFSDNTRPAWTNIRHYLCSFFCFSQAAMALSSCSFQYSAKYCLHDGGSQKSACFARISISRSGCSEHATWRMVCPSSRIYLQI